MTIRLLVAEDKQIMAKGLEALLQAEPDFEVVGVAADGKEAVDLAAKLKPDVILLDVRMPKLDGIEALKRIRAANPEARALIFTDHLMSSYVHDAFRAKARGYLQKHAPPQELFMAIREVAQGKRWIPDEVLGRLTEEPVPITEREKDVLQGLAKGLSNKEIAAKLGVGVPAVRNHITALLDKLEATNRVELLLKAFKLGLVDLGD